MDKRSWRVVAFAVERAQEDMASWVMMQLGANGCEIQEKSDAIPTAEGHSVLHATFELDKMPDDDTTRISAAMEEYGLSKSIASLRVSELLEEDWLAKWKTGFKPFPVGKRLLVCPEWERDELTDEQKRGREVIYIEPGLAFGTGFHPTTRFCLASVERCIEGAPRVLDVGTGSGILAIAAALLSKDRAGIEIVAVETDPLACKVALENFDLNGVSGRIRLIEGSTDSLLEGADVRPFDLVLSNLTYEDNSALLSDYLKLTQPGSHFAFAGILKEKSEKMRESLKSHGLKVIDEEVGDMWVGLLAIRP